VPQGLFTSFLHFGGYATTKMGLHPGAKIEDGAKRRSLVEVDRQLVKLRRSQRETFTD